MLSKDRWLFDAFCTESRKTKCLILSADVKRAANEMFYMSWPVYIFFIQSWLFEYKKKREITLPKSEIKNRKQWFIQKITNANIPIMIVRERGKVSSEKSRIYWQRAHNSINYAVHFYSCLLIFGPLSLLPFLLTVCACLCVWRRPTLDFFFCFFYRQKKTVKKSNVKKWFRRLLERTAHPKVWLAFAKFEQGQGKWFDHLVIVWKSGQIEPLG